MPLRGWKEITKHTKLSIKAIKELSRRPRNPFPLIYISRKPFITKKLFVEWIEAENEAQNKTCQ